MKQRPRSCRSFLIPLATLALAGHLAFHAEEDPPEPFHYDHVESVLLIHLSGPQGTVLDNPTSTLPVEILVERHSWEVWRRASDGEEEARNASTLPEPGATVTFSGERGSPGEATATTDEQGLASTSFTGGGTLGAPVLYASIDQTVASLSFDQPGESWSFDHTEATLAATLEAPEGNAAVGSGQGRSVVLSVAYESWDVEVSNYGEFRAVNGSSSAASGASVSWSVESGDGYVSGSGTVDGDGRCETGFVMGSVDSVVRADISYATGHATHATLFFSAAPPEPDPGPDPGENGPVLVRTEHRPAFAGFNPDGPSEAAEGETRNLSGTLRWDVWDIWADAQAGEEAVYNYSYDASGVQVDFGLDYGDGTLGSGSTTTDGTGGFSVSYTMGPSPARITASADFGYPTSASMEFTSAPGSGGGGTNPDWQFLENEGEYSLHGPNLDGPSYGLLPGDSRNVSVNVTWDSWEVWIDTATGLTEERERQSVGISHTVDFTVDHGDGNLSGSGALSVVSSSAGDASAPFTMGGQPSRIVATLPGTDRSVSIDLTPPPAPPVTWTHVRTEGTITLTLETDPQGAPVVPGANLPLKATAFGRSWELWESNDNRTELRNENEGPAMGVAVNFALSGPGSLTVSQPTADSDGATYATLTVGEEGSTTVAANVTFHTATATAELVVDAGQWTESGSGEDLIVTLGPAPWIGYLDVLVQWREYTVWTHPAFATPQVRTVSTSPAENAQVSMSGGATFAEGPHATGTDGRVQIAYTAGATVTVAASAEFAGLSGGDDYAAAAADGLGIGNGTNTNQNGTGNNNQNTNQNQTNNNTGNTTTPTLAIPEIKLKVRAHGTAGGEELEIGGGAETTPNPEGYFEADLILRTTDIETGVVTESEPRFVTGPLPRRDEILNPLYNEGYELLSPVREFPPVIGGEGPGGSDSTGSEYIPFIVFGHDTNVSSYPQPLGLPIATASVVEDHVLADVKWTGGVGNMGFGEANWAPAAYRIQFGDTVRAGEPATATADFTDLPLRRHFPSVTWAECWPQAASPIPEEAEPQTRTYLLHAKSYVGGTFQEEWCGTATFTIPNEGADAAVRRVPAAHPVVSLPGAEEWVQANPNGTLLLKPPVEEGVLNMIRLLPIDITAHRRGTFDAPGAVSPDGTYGRETVLLENADNDEGSATHRDLDTADLDKTNDDDLVKVVLSFPANVKPSGIGLKIKHEGMKVDGTKTTFDSAVVREGESRLNFYDNQGNKLTNADLKIDNLASPGNGYMAKIVTDGTLTLFLEGADKFGLVGISDQSSTNAKYMGGALLTLEITGAGSDATSGPRLLVFRGGFMRYRHPNGQPGAFGILEFRDGKGRITNDNTDFGAVIKTWSAKSGATGGAPYNMADGNGHIPPGWRYIFKRDDFSGTQRNQEAGSGNSLVVSQGSYCRWLQDDYPPSYTAPHFYRENDANDRGIGKPEMPDTTSPSGQTIMFKFQTEVIPPTDPANRTHIQFHPDGRKDGSAGCISIQSYDDCKEVFRYLHNYKALKLKVDLE